MVSSLLPEAKKGALNKSALGPDREKTSFFQKWVHSARDSGKGGQQLRSLRLPPFGLRCAHVQQKEVRETSASESRDASFSEQTCPLETLISSPANNINSAVLKKKKCIGYWTGEVMQSKFSLSSLFFFLCAASVSKTIPKAAVFSQPGVRSVLPSYLSLSLPLSSLLFQTHTNARTHTRRVAHKTGGHPWSFAAASSSKLTR